MNKQLIVIEVGESPAKLPRMAIFNPQVEPIGTETEPCWEACLSVPNLFAKVKRFSNIRLTFLDENANKKALQASGLHAAIIQVPFFCLLVILHIV